MSLFLTDLYLVPLDSSLEYKEEFCLYLKRFLSLTINYRLQILNESEDTNESYTFFTDILLSNPIKSDNLIFSETSDTQPSQEEQLELLSPENPKGFEFTLTLDSIIQMLLSTANLFSFTILGKTTSYFGIPNDLWYPQFPVKFSDVLKAVDFGTEDNPPLNLFYPIFVNFRDNINIYYSSFLNERRNSDVNNTQL